MAGPPHLSIQWRTQVREPETWGYMPQEYARPVFLERTDDLVVGASDGHLSRLRAGSGEFVWRVPLDGMRGDEAAPIHATPVVTRDTVYAATIAGVVQARELNDGELRWEYRAEDAIESEMTEHNGRVFFTDAREILYALDAETGKLLWRYQRRAPEFFTMKGAGTPVVDGDVVYCGFADGTLAALQIDSGELVWSADLTNDETEFTDVDMPVIVTEQTIYVASYSGGLFALSRLDGTLQWRYDIDSVSRVMLYRDVLYVASAQGRVVAFDVEERQPLWAFRFKRDTPVELSTYAGYLFVSTSAGPLMILDRMSGKPLAKWHPSQGFNTPLVMYQQRGFLLSNAGFLYGLEVGTLGAQPEAQEPANAL